MASRSCRWVAAIATMAHAAASPATMAAAPPVLGAGVLQVLARLRGSAEALVKEETVLLDGSEKKYLNDAEATMQADSAAAKRQNTVAVQQITMSAEASLAEMKSMLATFRRDAVRNGRRAAISEARTAEREAIAKAAAWSADASKFVAEAERRRQEANTAFNTSLAAMAAVETWRSKWPLEEINRGIASSQAANASASEMHVIAVAVERTDAAADDEALKTMATVREAVEVAQRAALIAREAVDQAAQNSAKLQTIRALVARSESADATADRADAKAATAA